MSMPSRWSVAIHHHGAERQPVVVIDHFAADPALFVEDAGFLSFAPIGDHYPGIRARVPDALMRPLLADLAPIVAEVFGLAATAIVDCFYSLVTMAPDDLAPIQRLPHFDGVEEGRLALLHYLSRDARGGTAFYRHRATAYESIDAARLHPYRAALKADLAAHGVPPPGYIAGDTAIFEQIGTYEAVWNRAILYRSAALHCALVPDDMVLAADPAQGRFTVNTFLEPARR